MNRALPFLGIAAFLAVGCNPLAKKDSAADAAATVVDAGPAPLEPTAVAAAPDAKDAGGQAADWPEGTNQELRLTWAVYPPQGEGEASKRNLELVARIGTVVRRFAFGPVQGGLFPQAQGICNPARKTGNEVAEIAFYLGGETSFVAKRTKPDLIEVESTSGPDVECKDCEKKKIEATFKIPADARIVEAISDIPAPGKEAPFDCTPPTKLTTVAGEVTIDEAANKGYFVKLGTKTVFQSNPANPGPKPQLYTRAKGKAGFDEVIVFSQIAAAPTSGKGCNPYGYWFLGLKSDGSHKVSKTVPYCGSATARAKLTSATEKMTLSLPERPKTDGSGNVPAETWVFEHGAVKKL